MKKDLQLIVTFQVELADRSVGIMGESFAAWCDDENEPWCELTDYGKDLQSSTFAWFAVVTGETAEPPRYALMLQALLFTFAESYYNAEDHGDDR